MDAPATPPAAKRRSNTPLAWVSFFLMVFVATWFLGPLALMVLAVVAGGALIVSGVRASGWPRPALMVVGAILVALPVFVFIDMATGGFVITLR